MDRRDRGAATDRPAGGSKWVWIVGAVFLAIIILLGIWGFGYGVQDPDYSEDAPVVDAPAN